MKHILLSKNFIFGVITLGLLSSCADSSGNDYYADIEMLPAKVKGDDNFSLYKPDGKIVYRDQLHERPSEVIDGVFSMATSDGVAIYSASDAEEPRLIIGGFAAVGQPADGVIPVVRPESRIEIVTLSGETVSALLPYEGREVTQSFNRFSEQRLGVETEGGNWGYVDTKGEWVITPGYFFGGPFSEGKAIVVNEKPDGNGYTYSVIDKDGNELYALPEGIFAIEQYFVDGYAFCKGDNNGPVYKLTDDFKLIQMPSDIRTAVQRYDDLAVYFSEDLERRGVFDKNGNTVIAPEYPALTILDRNHFLVINQDKTEWQIINREADVVKAFPGAIHVEDLGRFGLGVVDENSEVTVVGPKDFRPVDAGTVFSDFDNGKPQTLRMTSQYFDWDALADDIVGLFEGESIGKYKLGRWASEMLPESYDVTKDPTVHLGELGFKRKNYSVNVFGGFIEDELTVVHYIMTGENDYQLRMFNVVFETRQPVGAYTAAALQHALQKAGFTMTDVTDDNAPEYSALYINDNSQLGVFVNFEAGSDSGMVTLFSTKVTKKYADNLRKNIIAVR